MAQTGWLDLPRELREYVYFQAHRLSFRPTLDRIPSSPFKEKPVHRIVEDMGPYWYIYYVYFYNFTPLRGGMFDTRLKWKVYKDYVLNKNHTVVFK